ncbi:anti-sigma regulatory factor [Goodfellowiella coeruleoviolacea]|uniref:Serine/threonine-protein kinase RsbT n=1 Tax=Goodfellowiella coeruleoviolacea TaxID=334858 RepID=A0AAE3GDX4_9PSEU|nr:anti-sigma regulatory factor [Goodfellowiella coeruleoviolacea]MCP2166511.1 serine/threonine-protein kinase RsbT [Goodfellowiella coeruleoviolacea]
MTTTAASRVVQVSSEMDIVRVRQAAREAAVEAGFSLVEQTKLVTAASELARNTLVHGGGGQVSTELTVQQGRTVIRMVFTDSGPGIADVDQALADGFSTRGGMGLGLGGAKRLVDHFAIETGPDRGTVVTISSAARRGRRR